ncbi:General substrate transporter [Tolypocladium paradoxum]|uniref:General substrate transporter n=1 Tax=Tolypocladium paradoxum TaxID=94208 RepID=A0A2S4L4A2_9HYPO|nr:General substrate transporter [Tolypocladium paradoxum]
MYIVTGISIFFFGYEQGLMGGVNTTRDYAERMGPGTRSEEQGLVVVDKPLRQGGIVAVHYLLGMLGGCLLDGWFGDRYRRVTTIGLSRVLNGIGTGILNTITPFGATGTASHTSRGQFVAAEFTLNIFSVLLLPTIFSKLHEKTLYISGAVNILSIRRRLGAVSRVKPTHLERDRPRVCHDSIWTWEAEKNFARLKEEHPQLVQAAESGHGLVGPEHGIS